MAQSIPLQTVSNVSVEAISKLRILSNLPTGLSVPLAEQIPKSLRPNGYWKERENQRKFLQDLSHKLGIKDQRGWHNIDYRVIIKNGGESLIKRHKSIVGLLQYAFPGFTFRQSNIFVEYSWKPEDMKNLPKGFWDDKTNQRKFLDGLSKELGIKEVKDWNNITVSQMRPKSGDIILKKYGNNIKRMLKEVYPGWSMKYHCLLLQKLNGKPKRYKWKILGMISQTKEDL